MLCPGGRSGRHLPGPVAVDPSAASAGARGRNAVVAPHVGRAWVSIDARHRRAAIGHIFHADDFDKYVQVGPTGDALAEDISQTVLARLFSEACTVIESPRNAPQLVWIHGQGMIGPWDGPLMLQQSLLDEDDPPPIASMRRPICRLPTLTIRTPRFATASPTRPK